MQWEFIYLNRPIIIEFEKQIQQNNLPLKWISVLDSLQINFTKMSTDSLDVRNVGKYQKLKKKKLLNSFHKAKANLKSNPN